MGGDERARRLGIAHRKPSTQFLDNCGLRRNLGSDHRPIRNSGTAATSRMAQHVVAVGAFDEIILDASMRRSACRTASPYARSS